MLDKGISYTIEEVRQHIEDKDVLDWLEVQFPFNNPDGPSLDFSMFKREDRDFLHNGLEEILGGYYGQEKRKWGIERNGLCLLVSWTTEIVRGINHTDLTNE